MFTTNLVTLKWQPFFPLDNGDCSLCSLYNVLYMFRYLWKWKNMLVVCWELIKMSTISLYCVTVCSRHWGDNKQPWQYEEALSLFHNRTREIQSWPVSTRRKQETIQARRVLRASIRIMSEAPVKKFEKDTMPKQTSRPDESEWRQVESGEVSVIEFDLL